MSNVCSTSVRHLLNVYCSVFLIYCTATSVNICRVWTICGKAWHKMAWFYQSLIMFTWFYYKILYTIYILQLVSDWPSLVGICAVIQPAVQFTLSCWTAAMRSIGKLKYCHIAMLASYMSFHVALMSSYVLSCHVAMLSSCHPAMFLSCQATYYPVMLQCCQAAILPCS